MLIVTWKPLRSWPHEKRIAFWVKNFYSIKRIKKNNSMTKKPLSSFFSQAAPFLILGLLALFMLILSSCADHTTPTKTPGQTPSKFGYGGTNGDDAFVATEQTITNSITADTAPTNAPSSTPPTNPFVSPAPQPPAVVNHDLPNHDVPYGIPVPGKSGFVTSPHSPNAGYVDVRGFPPGTEVKDPYSGKVFLVP
jgi:hypothetical protein